MSIDLDISGVSKYFGAVTALKDINLEVEKGSFVCLLGPSGCGKTTLLRIIAGFEKANEGQLLLDGVDISNVPPYKRDFGMVFQSLALFPHMSVADNIAYGLKLRGMSKEKRKSRVEELLHVIALPSIADRPVSALSGGQRQRVAIARALAVQPKLFLLDEPLSALDAQLRDSMQIELRQLQQEFGVTTILVTHDQNEAMMLADKLVVLKDGRINQAGTPAEVYRSPVDAFTAEFIGASNIIEGVASANGSVRVLNSDTNIPTTAKPGSPLKVSVRAENIDIHPLEMADGNESIGRVEFIRELGANTELLVTSENERLRVRLRSDAATLSGLSTGQQVAIHFDPAGCIAFST